MYQQPTYINFVVTMLSTKINLLESKQIKRIAIIRYSHDNIHTNPEKKINISYAFCFYSDN